MTNIFSDEIRRNPYPLYDQLRSSSPLFKVPPPFNAWLIFDYANVKQALGDHDAFSSSVPGPRHWFIFIDPPRHSKLRALISRAFTPHMIASLEPLIRQLSNELLDYATARGQMDLAAEFSVPLPMKVIATMIGIPSTDWARFKRWSDTIMTLSYARSGGEEATQAANEFTTVTGEMNDYLTEMIKHRQATPQDDLLTRLIQAEVDGERLTQEEILGFFQLLIVGGQETTTNLINNAVLCLLEHPGELDRLRATPALLSSAVEEVLRYRSPLQWVMRTPRRPVQLHGQNISPGELVLAMIGSANRDPAHFHDPGRFDIARNPNAHIAFGHGIHSCLGAALSRMETKIALTDLLRRLQGLELVTDEPWEPRKALNVHGPARLPIRFKPASESF